MKEDDNVSIGYGGYAHLVQADETLVIYTCCCYNVNLPDYKRFMEIEDGELYIDRDAFVEPEIHKKIKKTSSGKKKKITKRILRDVPLGELFETKKIRVKNASGTWKTMESGIDMMACKILFKMFNEYQEAGKLPDKIGWFS